MKNAHGVPPTRYMKREGSRYAIGCYSYLGPVFGDSYIFGHDISIGYHCNKENSCYINNDGRHGYECDPEHKKSLFVNTARSDETNWFSVLDYEVYTHN